MKSLSSPAPRVKASRKPLAPVNVTGRLTTGINTGLADLFNEAAVLTICGPTGVRLYWLGAITDAGRIVGLQLRKFATGELYRVTLNGASWECDCPDSTFRQRACKHIVALHDALTAPGEDLAPPRKPDRKTERDELAAPDAA